MDAPDVSWASALAGAAPPADRGHAPRARVARGLPAVPIGTHVGALTTSLDLASGALTAGAVFERIWLRTTLLGAELQPFAASAVLSLPACEWVAPHVRAALVGAGTC